MNHMLYQLENGIATITIHRPQVLNALNEEAILELTQLLRQAEADHDVLCIVLNASGEKAFCVGGDIKAEVNMDGYAAYDFSLMGQNLIRTLLQLRVPVIAAMHGP